MNKKSTIDQLFKDQLQELPVTGKEELWKQLENKLDSELNKGASKKRYLLILLLFAAGGTGVFFLTNNYSSKIIDKNTVAAISGQVKQKATAANISADKSSSTPSLTGILNGPPKRNTAEASQDVSKAQTSLVKTIVPKNSVTENDKALVSVKSAPISEDNGYKITEAGLSTASLAAASSKVNNENASVASTQPVMEKKAMSVIPIGETGMSTANAKKEKHPGDASFGITAGMDIFLQAKETGSYAGFQWTLPLNKKVNLSTGLLISKHKMQENYSNAEKQRINPDKQIDAKLEGLTVVQLPILYEQPLPNPRIQFRAGLTPTYIIAAGIYNVPNSFSGNAANYRKFTLNDLHRLNVLFTAGVGIGIVKHLELDIKGNYGLTELVRNSYINQSSVNNNFKSAQVGLVYKFRKQ